MRQWHISISGGGVHDNGAKDDVEQLAKKFVEDLKAVGHQVYSAGVHIGSSKRIPEDVGPLKEPDAMPPVLSPEPPTKK